MSREATASKSSGGCQRDDSSVRHAARNCWSGSSTTARCCAARALADRFRSAKRPLIMAVTQPTPAWIEMAAVGQFRAHAPHSMQSSRLAISAFLPTISNTAWGQTLTHIPQPIHRCWFNCSVTTFLMYFSFGMTTFSNGVHLGHSARLHESSRDPEGQSEGRRKHLCRYGDPHFPANARERCVRGRSYETHGNEAGDRWNQQCPAQHGRPTS